MVIINVDLCVNMGKGKDAPISVKDLYIYLYFSCYIVNLFYEELIGVVY